MKKSYRRTPKDYDGPGLTTHKVSDVLPFVLKHVEGLYKEHADSVLLSWPEVIGPQLAPMTQAVSFKSGTLVVKVKNSTLYSLLSQNDKPRILQYLQQKFPNLNIRNIDFRMN
jgi:hypothetical protein